VVFLTFFLFLGPEPRFLSMLRLSLVWGKAEKFAAKVPKSSMNNLKKLKTL
jgi:hypothetical protein